MHEDVTQRVRRRLRVVRWVGVIDLILLVVLLASSLAGNRELVRLFGPLHGGNYLLLLTVVSLGAVDGLWRWWFPAAVLLSGGPLGALIGEWYIVRQLGRDFAPRVEHEANS